MNKKYNPAIVQVLVFCCLMITSYILHYPQMNKDLIGIHVWRQTQTQWNIINFYRHDFNIFNPRICNYNDAGTNILRYEFPLMQWLIALVIKIFGESIIVTRTCMFLFGAAGVAGMYKLTKLLSGSEIPAWATAWSFACSPVFFYYTINPLPDIFALSASVWFLYYFFKYVKERGIRNVYLSALFLLIAVLVKLPYVVLAGGLCLYLLSRLREKEIRKVILIYAVLFVPAVAWYCYVIPGWGGNGVVYGILKGNTSLDHYRDILEYHKTVMFPKLLLGDTNIYIFVIGVLFALYYEKYRKKIFWLLFASLFGCILYWLLELGEIDRVHDYYMMPFLPVLYLIAGYGFVTLWRSNIVMKTAVIVFVVVMANVVVYETRNSWSVEESYVNPDIFVYKDDLRKAAPSDAKCIMFSDSSPFVYPYYFDKMGYMMIYNITSYSAAEMKTMITKNGVRYMYSDKRGVDSSDAIRPFEKRFIMQRGSIKVFELQDSPQTKL